MSTATWIDTSMKGVAWTRTCREKRINRSALSQDAEADLVVVGGGFLGLTTALSAARSGLRVILLEGGIVGVGASGRNGGYCVPHFPSSLRPKDVEASLGSKKGQALIELVGDGANSIAALNQRYGIQSDYTQNGWIQPAHSNASLAKVRAVYEDWKAFGAPVEWLEGDQVRQELGASTYIAGWKNPTGAVMNPFGQCLGLARAAEAEGAVIYEMSRVTNIRQDDGQNPIVTCHTGGRSLRVCATQVLLATNAYTDQLGLPGINRSFLSVRLFHCATAPLSEDELQTVLPNHNCFTDLRRSGGFGRLDPEGRLIAGGAVFTAAGPAYGLRHARKRMRALFPQLRDNPLEFPDYWEGYCALTDGSLPLVQRMRPNVFALTGFSTRGVNLAENIGLVMGELFAGRRSLDDVPLEVVDGARQIFMQGFKTAVGRQIFPLFQLKDRLGLT